MTKRLLLIIIGFHTALVEEIFLTLRLRKINCLIHSTWNQKLSLRWQLICHFQSGVTFFIPQRDEWKEDRKCKYKLMMICTFFNASIRFLVILVVVLLFGEALENIFFSCPLWAKTVKGNKKGSCARLKPIRQS